uniref:Uncharacterized protein n=1 Tax=Panagrolaimus superbus TaxID=310955 RepID=A0A914Y722_9BILA
MDFTGDNSLIYRDLYGLIHINKFFVEDLKEFPRSDDAEMIKDLDVFLDQHYEDSVILFLEPDILERQAHWNFDLRWGKKDLKTIVFDFLNDLTDEIHSIIEEIAYTHFSANCVSVS